MKVIPAAAVMSVNFASGISACTCAGATGAVSFVTWEGLAAGLRFAYQIAPPAMAAIETRLIRDQRKARPMTASSRWAASSSGLGEGAGLDDLGAFGFIRIVDS